MGTKKKRDKEKYRAHQLGEIGEQAVPLRGKALPYHVFGEQYIERGALEQMQTAMRLPVARAGALMSDAHLGYGLPIGGVLATEPDKVIPYAVGVDIACRMCMTVFPEPPSRIDEDAYRLKKLLGDHTHFGVGVTNKRHLDESLFDRPEWNCISLLRDLKDLARSQLGTSGAGNHFVEWGRLRVQTYDDLAGLPPGEYLALLSHSGSRGFGNEVAAWYAGLAMKKTILPRGAQHLAWLSLASQEGQEYWTAMNLAGDYASANHHEIHRKIAGDFGVEPLVRIENHHNFAWKETLADGREVTVHRKGATPAFAGSIGIIPGSMSQDGYVVRGKGGTDSLNSASHGAGRVMSRNQAFRTIDRGDLDRYLQERGIRLIGGDVDESPAVYKDLSRVMASQSALVGIIASFSPVIVRMAPPEKWARKRPGLDI